MDNLIISIIAFAIVGFFSGFASGLFGIGGGTVRVPVFIYLFPWLGIAHSVTMHIATATSMALVVPSAITSTRKQKALGNLDLDFFKSWAIGLFFGVAIGVVLIPFASTEALQSIFAVYIIVVGIYTALGHGGFSFGDPPSGVRKLGIASVVGAVAALTGTAGGTLTTPILTACKIALPKAIAISSATGLVTGTVGALGGIVTGWHASDLPAYSLGYVDPVIFLVMLPTVILGAPLGVRVGHRMSEKTLRLAYAILLIIIGLDLLRRLIFQLL